MPNALIKTSPSWFLRPPSLENSSPRSKINTVSECRILMSSEEEYSIRKYCPVTLSHLLPDLPYTRKRFIDEGSVEYSANLLRKFERHLQESHYKISGSTTSVSDEESDSDNNLNDRIENDLSCNSYRKRNGTFRREELLMKKINYPEDSMETLLPNIILNNKRAISPAITKHFCTGCIKSCDLIEILPRMKPKIFNSFSTTMKNNDVDKLRKKNTISRGNDVDKLKDQNLRLPNFELPKEINVKRQLVNFDDHLQQRAGTSIPHKSLIPLAPSYSNRIRSESYRLHSNRSKSSSPNRNLNLTSRPAIFENATDGIIPPSPHMVELARLRQEGLKIKEKMLLKKRQIMEIDRLRPPLDRWYEMKDGNFHEEAYRNNIYLKNERILPLIQERRQACYDTLKILQ